MIRVATFNVQSLPLMRPEQVREDVRLAARKADVILWQEIKVKSYRAVIEALGTGWDHYFPKGPGSNTPISWRKRMFTLDDKGAELLHDGVKKVCEDRGITWARLTRKGTKHSIVFVNTHYVARAWDLDGTASLRKDKAEAESQPLRQDMWNEGNERHKAVIELARAEGYAVIGGGDFNRGGNWNVLGKRIAGEKVAYIDNGGGLDYLYSLNGDNTRIQKERARTFRAHSDHPLKTVHVNLRKKG